MATALVNSGTQNTAFPQAGEPIVDLTTGVLTRPWQRFLANIWNKAGAGTSLTSTGYLAIVNGSLNAYQAVTGMLLGRIALFGQQGQPAVPLIVTASPFVFASPGTGTVVVESGQVELARNGIWYIAGLAGGAVPVLITDQVRVTYYNTKPAVTYLPT